MLDTAERNLLAEYRKHTTGIRGQTQSVIDEVFDQMVTAHLQDVERMATVVAPVLEAAQRSMAVVTEQYLRQDLALVGVRPARFLTADVSSSALRHVTSKVLLERVGPTIFAALAAGQTVEAATELGRQRATKQALTNIQLAKTHTAKRTLENNSRVVGWRRVLNGPKNCALCVIASTQRYHRSDLAPIHPACDCGVLPITGDRDPGWVIDEETLQSAHNAIRAQFGTSDAGARSISGPLSTAGVEADVVRYRDVLLVREHGEIGPVLTWKKHEFFKPTDRH